jgi:hypothetical protein
MRTSELITLAALTLWTALAPAWGQTVVWDRKAHGDIWPCLGSGTWQWPNNNSWSQDEHWGYACAPAEWVMTQPSNWSTPGYPNDPTNDVILGSSGGAPTHLNVSATLHSLTILPDGALDLSASTTLTADAFDFQGDGAIPPNGGGGYFPILKITDGGSMT